MEGTTAPTAWYLAAVDSVFPGAIQDALDHEAILAGRAVPTDRFVHPATPLYDARFNRVTGIDAVMSAEIADHIRAAGAVDANDRWGHSPTRTPRHPQMIGPIRYRQSATFTSVISADPAVAYAQATVPSQ